MAELPGILVWAIEGLNRLRARGHFVQPQAVDDAVRDMEDLASPVLAFVRDCCEVGAGRRTWVDEMYERLEALVRERRPHHRHHQADVRAGSARSRPRRRLPQAQHPGALLRWHRACRRRHGVISRSRFQHPIPRPWRRLYRDDRGLVPRLYRDEFGHCGTGIRCIYRGLVGLYRSVPRTPPLTHAYRRARAHAGEKVHAMGCVAVQRGTRGTEPIPPTPAILVALWPPVGPRCVRCAGLANEPIRARRARHVSTGARCQSGRAGVGMDPPAIGTSETSSPPTPAGTAANSI